jgi:hypothetical protein
MSVKRPILFCAALVAVFLAWNAGADIYKYVDEDGNVTFTDRFRPGAVKVMSDFAPSRGHAGAKARTRTVRSSPADFPRVSPSAQRQRDDLRRQILLDERSHETTLLRDAEAELAASVSKPAPQIERLRDAVRRHRENLVMLDKELSRLK